MPCGQLDRRRVGHRCVPCKTLHVKCDGGRPCARCRARGLECVTSGGLSSAFQFVNQNDSSRTPRTIVQDSWKYISLYFQALGSLTQASVLRSSTVVALSHQDEGINRSLSIMGAIYACRNSHVLKIDAKERRNIMETLTMHKSAIATELKKPTTARLSYVLLNALILATVELLLDHASMNFQSWLGRISSFLKSYSNSEVLRSFTPFEKALLRLFQVLDVLSAIGNFTAPLGPQFSSDWLSTTPQALEPSSERELLLDNTKVDVMLSSMWQWATLSSRMISWASAADAQQLFSENEDEKLREFVNIKVQGLDMICEASALQARLIENLLHLSQEPQDPVSLCMTPYYHWALTGLSHQLQHDAWTLLQCDVPIMPAEMLHEQALVALDCVEMLAGRSGLDVALYLPFADFVGLQMKTPTEQNRMLSFLELVHRRGFNVADLYRQCLLQDWQLKDNGFHRQGSKVNSVMNEFC